MVTWCKDGRVRVCIDYSRLNKVVERNHYPMPLIEDVIDAVADSEVHSILDLKDGFFHIDVAEETQKYLSLVTPWGQYIPKKAPFGFCNVPPEFSAYVRKIFQRLIELSIIVIYMDDIFIKARNEKEALERLKMVLDIAGRHGLRFNWKKCVILQRRVEFLGYVIENGKITPAAGKVEVLLNYPRPTTQKQLQRLLGLTGYFRKFIQGYAEIAKPLSDLLRKTAKFNWEAPQEKAFVTLKQALSQAPVLQLYRLDRETELHCDATIDGYGSILLQRCPEDKALHPVYFMSRKTTDAEKRYHSYELETLAVIRAVKKFRIYLQGIRFKILTDCSALQHTLKCGELKPKFARWAMYLEQFEYTIEHRPGSKMQHVDALSRRDCVLAIHDPIFERIERAQRHDEKLQAVRSILEDGRDFRNYTLDNGLIFEKKGEKQLLVVPAGMREEIIKRAHEFGHFRVKKTIEKLQQEFSIEKIEKNVQRVIECCVPCILGARKEGKQEGFLKTISKEGAPLHTWHIDHVGPLPSTSKNYKYLLTVVDGFAKYTWLFALKGAP